MRMIQRALDIVHSCVRHARAVEHFLPVLRRVGLCYGGDEGLEDGAVGDALGVGCEAWVGGPVGLAEFGCEDSEEPVVATA